MRDQNAATSQIVMAIIIHLPPVLPYSVTGYRGFIIHDPLPECKGKNEEKDSFLPFYGFAEAGIFPVRPLQIRRLVVYCKL